MSPASGFARHVARSVLVTGLGNAVGKVLRAVALFIVLKVVAPEHLGAATLVITVSTLLSSVTELGLGGALVQARTIGRREIDSLFWLALLLAGTVYLALFVASPLLAAFYDDSGLTGLLRVQATTIVLHTFAFVPRGLLTRDLQFGRLAVIDNVSHLLQSAVMVWLALEGFGAWAFIWGEVSCGSSSHGPTATSSAGVGRRLAGGSSRLGRRRRVEPRP